MKKGWFCVSDFNLVEPDEPGCYAIYILNIKTYKKRLIYIGMAQNLRTRLARHEVKKVLRALIELPELTYVKCKIIRDNNKRKYTEKWLINRLNPPANY